MALQIIVPVVGEPDNMALVEAINRLLQIGHVLVVVQGKPMQFLPDVEVLHFHEMLGIWGAVEKAYFHTMQAGLPDDVEAVVFNLAPLVIPPLATTCIGLGAARFGGMAHVAGERLDIAGSLSGEPTLGRARARGEQALTTMVNLLLTGGKNPDLIKDGFVGLHGLTLRRFEAIGFQFFDVFKRTRGWGGAIQLQIQTVQNGWPLRSMQIETSERCFEGQFGSDPKQVMEDMFVRALTLPIFQDLFNRR